MPFIYLPAIAIIAYTVLEYLKNKKYNQSTLLKILAIYDMLNINAFIIYGFVFDGYFELIDDGWNTTALIAGLILLGIPSSIYHYHLIKVKSNWVGLLTWGIALFLLIRAVM
ncbi:hypothetical protein [Carboxylicivirga marina]|uniref:Uncharacterized protein n=1 Tax=Carboxylicivirga marina TaxID=2800988 RepID=A0ABS1HMH7_9BACT|nr:hypothetical protein [Carboxylicivirga marina]MBK3518655.1 hypothetical protein [Carboxylicivirga marina]